MEQEDRERLPIRVAEQRDRAAWLKRSRRTRILGCLGLVAGYFIGGFLQPIRASPRRERMSLEPVVVVPPTRTHERAKTTAARGIQKQSKKSRAQLMARTGEAGNAVLHNSECIFDAATQKSSDPAMNALDERFADARRQLRLAQLDGLAHALEFRQRIGEAPWERDTFQMFEVLGQREIGRVVGRDFEMWASPERSLDWYQSRAPKSPTDDARSRALNLLVRYERRRRELLASLVTTVWAQANRKEPHPLGAYILQKSTLRWLPRAESQRTLVELHRARTGAKGD